MQIKRRFTTAGKSPYEKVPFRRATSEIKNPDGSVVFKLENFAVPEHWSPVAADILAQKYFRKAGVPARLKRIDGPSQGHYYVDHVTGELTASTSAYEHPQPHACFIQSIEDDLVGDSGIMDLWVREARLFKYGSGTGSNFSKLRAENERLSGGGKSSGLMSFLKIGDRAAGAIKSGGTTRRAAKMVVVDIDHPDIEDFIDWKVKEEQKVAALVTGSKVVKRHLTLVMKACVNCAGPNGDCFDPTKNPALKRAIKEARRDLVPDNYIRRIIQFARQGYKDIDFATYDADWDSEAYLTVSGQNSNNSVRVTDEFLKAVEADAEWDLNWRTGKRGIAK